MLPLSSQTELVLIEKQFIIQSDFITQASREDIFHNEWNIALRENVAWAFRDAILRFTNDEMLCTRWMRYLPSATVSEFWTPLIEDITLLLQDEEILEPWSGSALRSPRKLKWLANTWRDADDEPMFRDLPDEMYLSKSYFKEDLEILKKLLSVRSITTEDFLERVEKDLCRKDSYLKGTMKSVDWHDRVANLLGRVVDKEHTKSSNRVRRLDIIPLQNGSWTSSQSDDIYYPTDNNIPIPMDLGLRLIKKSAVEIPARSSLFMKLGAKVPDSAAVEKLIIAKYNKPRNVTLEESVAHHRYLYYFGSKDEEPLKNYICVFDQDCQPVYRAMATFGVDLIVDDLYFETDDEYGVKRMCSSPNSKFASGSVYPARFIHSAYLDAVSATARVRDRSWIAWLEIVAEVRYIPRLERSSKPSRLSPIAEAIINSCPETFIGWLHEHWMHYQVGYSGLPVSSCT